jgi:hypothetical protein
MWSDVLITPINTKEYAEKSADPNKLRIVGSQRPLLPAYSLGGKEMQWIAAVCLTYRKGGWKDLIVLMIQCDSLSADLQQATR